MNEWCVYQIHSVDIIQHYVFQALFTLSKSVRSPGKSFLCLVARGCHTPKIDDLQVHNTSQQHELDINYYYTIYSAHSYCNV